MDGLGVSCDLADLQAERAKVQRRTLRVVMLAQVLGGAGLAAGATVGALIAQDLLGGDLLAGLPAALTTLGSAATAWTVGTAARARGRRLALGSGFVVGALGAGGVVLAASTRSIALLFIALLVYGAGSATNLQARYAGTDLAEPAQRGRSASMALTWTTIGAVAGPSLVGPLGTLAEAIGLPRLAGCFLLAAVAYACAGVVLLVLLRPDPLLLARELHRRHAAARSVHGGDDDQLEEPHAPRKAVLGAVILVVTQITMVAIMTMTPVAMNNHHHNLTDIGLVIAGHIAAMYLPSPLSGWMTDTWGRGPTAIASVAVLLLAGVTAAAATGNTMAGTTVGLVLLGLGWNLGLVSGTALIVDGTRPNNRPRVQGGVDVLVALAGAAAGAMSGFIAAGLGYPTLAVMSGALALTILPALAWARTGRGATVPASVLAEPE